MLDVLERPIWHALHTRQAEVAIGGDRARRFPADVSPFAACADDGPEALAELGALIPEGGIVALLQATPSPVPPGAVQVAEFAGVQMIATSLVAAPGGPPVVELGEDDAPEMLALATSTRPGPFERRTHTLGAFVGIREHGRLVAMAGERLRLPGFTEVSGVCTLPETRGKGYAAHLSHVVATRILERGETPFLHAFADNTTAIRVYERLGFTHHRTMAGGALQRA